MVWQYLIRIIRLLLLSLILLGYFVDAKSHNVHGKTNWGHLEPNNHSYVQKENQLPELSSYLNNQPINNEDMFYQMLINNLQVINQAAKNTNSPSRITSHLAYHYREALKQYLQQNVQNQVHQFGESLGTIDASLTLDNDLYVNSFDIDFLLPIFMKQNRYSFFTQMGTQYLYGQTQVNFGLGYRVLALQYMVGVNVFEDMALHAKHKRTSVGAEVSGDYFSITSNYYLPQIEWRDQPFNDPSLHYKAHPVEGFDVGIKKFISPSKSLFIDLGYYRWIGKTDQLDPTGRYPLTANAEDLANPLVSNIHGLKVNLDWRPIPILGGNVTYTKTQAHQENFMGAISLIIRPDQDFVKQRQSTAVSEYRTVSGRIDDLVLRNKDLVLAYRGIRSHLIMVEIPHRIAFKEDDLRKILPTLRFTYPPKKYEWVGSGVELMQSPDHQQQATPVLQIPKLTEKLKKEKKPYYLKLKVTDWYNDVYESNEMQIEIDNNPKIRVRPKLFLDSNYQYPLKTPVKLRQNSIPKPIFWKLIWGRDYEVEPDEFKWLDPDNILLDSTEKYPLINTQVNSGPYKLNLFTKHSEGSELNAIPVEIFKTHSYSLSWENTDAQRGVIVRPFEINQRILRKAIVNLKDKTIQPRNKVLYSAVPIGDRDPVEIDIHTGNVLFKGIGEANILATLTEDEHYESKTIQYRLVITKSIKMPIKWEGGKLVKNKAHVDYDPGKTISVKAQTLLPTIVYYEADSASCDLIARTNHIDPNTTGEVEIVGVGEDCIIKATALETDNYLSNTIRYGLNIYKSQLNLKWPSKKLSSNNEYQIDFFPNTTFSIPAEGGMSTRTTNYSSSKPSVATVDNSGTVTLQGAGETKITASQEGDRIYSDDRISYTLKVKKGIDNTLRWQFSQDDGNVCDTVSRLCTIHYSEEQRFKLNAASQYSTGAIHYKLSKFSNHDLAQIDPITGVVQFKRAGDAIFEAVQQEDNNFKANFTTYRLKILKADPQLNWSYDYEYENTRRVRPGDSFQVNAHTVSTGQPILYFVSDPSIAKVEDQSTHTIRLLRTGTFKVEARVSENTKYRGASIFHKVEVVRSLQ